LQVDYGHTCLMQESWTTPRPILKSVPFVMYTIARMSADTVQMWMGTYPTVPSRVRATGELLLDHLKKNPDLVGESVSRRYGPDLPFLPKVRYNVRSENTPMTNFD